MKQWLDDFKLALIQEDINRLENLLDALDLRKIVEEFAKNSQNDEILKENVNDNFMQLKALLQEAVVLISEKKNSKAHEIQKFQKAAKYFED